MPDEVAVAFTVSGLRDSYLKRALESWARVRGVQDTAMLFCAEPQPAFAVEDFTGWVQRTFRRGQVIANEEVLGCLENTRQAFTAAFAAGARLAVMAEEDLVVSADVLEYLAWAGHEYERDCEVSMLCSHVKDSKSKDAGAVTRASWFNPLVCATWRDRWEELLLPTWGRWQEGVEGNQAWDNNLRVVLREAGKVSIFPVVSRVSHIGLTSTIYSPVISEYMYAQSVTTCFARDHRAEGFREVPFDSVPGLLV